MNTTLPLMNTSTQSLYRMNGDKREIQMLKAGVQVLLAAFFLRGLAYPLIADQALLVYFGYLLIAGCLIQAGISYSTTRKTQLKISAAGIEYVNLDYRLFTTWENIKSIGLGSMSDVQRKREESLILHHPVLCQRKPWALSVGAQVQAIRLTEFGAWRYTALGAELKKYASHVFEENAA